MSTDRERLIELEDAIRTGAVTLVLGPNANADSQNLSGQPIPSSSSTIRQFAEDHCSIKLNESTIDFDDFVAYCSNDKNLQKRYTDFLREAFSTKRSSKTYNDLSNFTWHRIYSYDVSDSIALAYRKNMNRSQSYRILNYDDPIDIDQEITDKLDIITMAGSVDKIIEGIYLNTPGFFENYVRYPWFERLVFEVKSRVTIFAGNSGDGEFLLKRLRHFLRKDNSPALTFVVSPGLSDFQIKSFDGEKIFYIDMSLAGFLSSINKKFPDGIKYIDVIRAKNPFFLNIDPHDELNACFSDFDIVDHNFKKASRNRKQLQEIGAGYSFARSDGTHQNQAGSIRRLYRGDEATWDDILDGIHADFSYYGNFRNRIATKFRYAFPGGSLFLLSGLAGFGKTIGLMSTAIWMVDYVDVPIFWLKPEGNLRRLIRAIDRTSHVERAVIFIDDIGLHVDALESLDADLLKKLVIICSSRTSRWASYAARKVTSFDIVPENIRKINHADAKAMHDKIKNFGTLIHFEKKTDHEQIQEIIERSGKDLLVLMKELGQGGKFEATVISEVNDLSEKHRFCYILACISYRAQISMPYDLFSLAISDAYDGLMPDQILAEMQSLISRRKGSKAITARHALIAATVIRSLAKQKNEELQLVVESLFRALSKFKIPIIVHHSNTGHARVFKSVINHSFLIDIFGTETAIDIYRKFEKAFDGDAFFWQQLGLTYSKCKNYDLALETLQHAVTVHPHHYIRHALAVAKLQCCFDNGRSILGVEQFQQLRQEGVEELKLLHEETSYNEDLAIVALTHHDLKISERYDSSQITHSLMTEYHTNLAFYCRENEKMKESRKIYDNLTKRLCRNNQDKTEDNFDDPFFSYL